MAKNKIRKYPQSVLRIEALPIMDINSYGQQVKRSDTSIGTSVSQAWITDNKLDAQAQMICSLYIQPQEHNFVEMLMQEDFSDSERNVSTIVLNQLVKRYRDAAQTWILGLYVAKQGDEHFLMQLFRLLRCFPYEFLAPASFILAGNGVHHNSDFVKSEALSLLDHWGNKEVYDMLQNHEPPTTPWLRMKYCAIRESLRSHVAIQEN